MNKEKMQIVEEGCCVVSCDLELDKQYWDNQWQSEQIGWDIGDASPQLINFIDKISDKNARILIPGCGSAYEAQYLLKNEFQDITLVDISPKACEIMQSKFKGASQIKVLCRDFFELKGSFDVILEQTFFCALPKNLRPRYAWKMNELLAENGRLQGLLFDREFDTSPPFGGSKTEYETLFSNLFHIEKMEISPLSIEPRAKSELAFSFLAKNNQKSNLYEISGVTCTGCKNEIEKRLSDMTDIIQVMMSIDFKEVLIISHTEISLKKIQEALAYEPQYHIIQKNT